MGGEATMPAAAARHSCAKLEVAVADPRAESGVIFVKATWLPSRFSLAVTDGSGAWRADASDAEVLLRAEQWDLPPAEYLALAERYLGFQQPGSRYAFEDSGDGNRRLSWTFERQGTKLEWRWKCQAAPDSKRTTSEILDFLMDANIRLSEEVIRKTQSFDKLRQEADKCLKQSERFSVEKAEFESAAFSKFVAILNSKKAKLRELRDRLAKLEGAGKSKIEDGSSEGTEIIGEGSEDDENVKQEPASEEDDGDGLKVGASRGRGHKKARK